MTKWQVEKNSKVVLSLRKRNIDEDDESNDVYWDLSEYYINGDKFDREGRINNLMNQPWEWYMLVNEREKEGFETVTVNRKYRETEVKEWLTEMGVKYIYMHPVYLLSDQMYVTMMKLKFS